MEQFNEISKQQILERIVNNLMLKSGSLDDLGLYDGKIGIVLFFYHYARYTKDSLYHDFADILLDDLCNEIHELLPITFSNGICGIAWSVNYLINQKFVEGEPEIILKELDEMIMMQNIRRIKDLSFETGLEGLYTYIKVRLLENSRRKDIFDPIFLQDLFQKCKGFTFRKDEEILAYIIGNNEIDLKNINLAKLGMNNGCSGFGLKLIFS